MVLVSLLVCYTSVLLAGELWDGLGYVELLPLIHLSRRFP